MRLIEEMESAPASVHLTTLDTLVAEYVNEEALCEVRITRHLDFACSASFCTLWAVYDEVPK